jgi:hypothetical protein
MLSDPRDAMAEQNGVVQALVGLAGIARMVRALAASPATGCAGREVDDAIHLLMGLVSLGDAVERLGATSPGGEAEPPDREGPRRWLR